jgi:hypothetical protein
VSERGGQRQSTRARDGDLGAPVSRVSSGRARTSRAGHTPCRARKGPSHAMRAPRRNHRSRRRRLPAGDGDGRIGGEKRIRCPPCVRSLAQLLLTLRLSHLRARRETVWECAQRRPRDDGALVRDLLQEGHLRLQEAHLHPLRFTISRKLLPQAARARRAPLVSCAAALPSGLCRWVWGRGSTERFLTRKGRWKGERPRPRLTDSEASQFAMRRAPHSHHAGAVQRA